MRTDMDIEMLRASNNLNQANLVRMQAEQEKFHAETLKLTAETAKYQRERWLVPIAIGAGFIGASLTAIVTFVAKHA